MQVIVSGKQVEIGESFRAYAEKRMREGISKYLDRVTQVQVVASREAHLFRVDVTANTGTHAGVIIRGRADSGDIYAALDGAAEKIEKQLRRYKRRLTDHHKETHHALPPARPAKKYVLKDEEEASGETPLIIAEKPTEIERLSVSAAVMKMDLSDLPALLFINSANDRLNVVYRRADGNISWVDPAEAEAAA